MVCGFKGILEKIKQIALFFLKLKASQSLMYPTQITIMLMIIILTIIITIIIIIIMIIIIISPHGLEIPGDNWHGIFSPLAVRLKCTRKIK